jgi:hypothetical protein
MHFTEHPEDFVWDAALLTSPLASAVRMAN